VADVAEGSPAAAAGVRAGDTIVTFDGADVPTALRLATRVTMYPEGQECDVVVRRNGAEQTLSVTLAAPRRCPIGIRLERPRGADLTVRVAAVEEDSPAAAADLRAGDEIVALDGQPLEFTGRAQRKAFERELRTGFENGKIYRLTVRRPAAEADGAATGVEVRLVAG